MKKKKIFKFLYLNEISILNINLKKNNNNNNNKDNNLIMNNNKI